MFLVFKNDVFVYLGFFFKFNNLVSTKFYLNLYNQVVYTVCLFQNSTMVSLSFPSYTVRYHRIKWNLNYAILWRRFDKAMSYQVLYGTSSVWTFLRKTWKLIYSDMIFIVLKIFLYHCNFWLFKQLLFLNFNLLLLVILEFI